MPAFGGLVLRAIALAWTDPDFKEALLYPPGGDASSVLSQWLGYNSPVQFQDQIRDQSWFALGWEKWNLDDARAAYQKIALS